MILLLFMLVVISSTNSQGWRVGVRVGSREESEKVKPRSRIRELESINTKSQSLSLESELAVRVENFKTFDLVSCNYFKVIQRF